MRQKRAKAYKKQMTIYLHTFRFREPYQTIIDDEIVAQCHKAHFDIVKGLNRTVQGETKPMITQCCMQALYKSDNQPAISVAKEFERRRCNHPPASPLSPGECIESIVNIEGENKHRYIVATQDYQLRKRLRKVPGVPMIFLNRSVMVMEPLSEASDKHSQQVENAKLTKGLNDVKNAGYFNKQEAEEAEEPVKKKKKGPKEPNPLSMKKKKAPAQPHKKDDKDDETKPKNRRRRTHKKQDGDDDSAKNEDKASDGENDRETAANDEGPKMAVSEAAKLDIPETAEEADV